MAVVAVAPPGVVVRPGATAPFRQGVAAAATAAVAHPGARIASLGVAAVAAPPAAAARPGATATCTFSKHISSL